MVNEEFCTVDPRLVVEKGESKWSTQSDLCHPYVYTMFYKYIELHSQHNAYAHSVYSLPPTQA